jgi:3-vinyl bacteriochlorophyllide hydratase
MTSSHITNSQGVFLYTPQQLLKRDQTVWTRVQAVLAIVQFVIFLASACLILRFFVQHHGQEIATLSVMIKTMVLYLIMLTGSIWEKKVFNVYLFAPAFFWEDMVSMIVLALHTAYLIAWMWDLLEYTQLLLLAVAAYLTYVINAAQFILKFRAAKKYREMASASVNTRMLAA